MPLMRAISSWMNREHEGMVHPGDEFEATEYRARDLVTVGLAVYAVSDVNKVRVTADPADPINSPTNSPPEPAATLPATETGGNPPMIEPINSPINSPPETAPRPAAPKSPRRKR